MASPIIVVVRDGWFGSKLSMSVVVALGVMLTHASGLDGAFVMDDYTLVTRTAHQAADEPLWRELLMYGGNGAPTAGRPVTALSVMLSLACADTSAKPPPRPFHFVNVGLHLAVALLLLAWLRRVFERIPRLREQADWLALATTGLWALHPIHAPTLASLGQRSETLMALGMIGALYCVMRGVDSARPRRWFAVAVVASWMSVLSKEVGAMCPLLVLLVDRALLAGSFARAWSARRGLYIGLLSTWPILAGILLLGPRTASVGFDGGGLTPLNYLLTQGNAIAHYLRLLAVPAPVLVDYGWPVVPVDGVGDLVARIDAYALGLVVTGGLFLWGAWALRRRPVIGFAAAFFFLILAPSSSVVPIYTEIMAPHRMYLPSLVPIGLVVIGCVAIARRLSSVLPLTRHFWQVLGAASLLAVSVGEGVLTSQLNLVFRSDVRLFMHHLPEQSENPRLVLNLGRALRARGDMVHARPFLEHAVIAARNTERPRAIFLVDALMSAAQMRLQDGDANGAAALLREAVDTAPERPDLRASLAGAYEVAGRADAAVDVWRESVRRTPGDPGARGALVAALLRSGRLEQARDEVRKLPGMQRPGSDIDAQLAEAARRIGRPDLARKLLEARAPTR